MTLEVTPEARDLLAQRGFNPLMGARPLGRVIQTLVQDPLAEAILAGTVKEGETVVVFEEEGEVALAPKTSAPQ